jgi:4-hydroxybenzoate polyprenyltransferase
MPEDRQPFTIIALFKITRFWNLVIIGFAQFFAAYFLVGYSTMLDWRLYMLSASTVLIAAGGYIINDYYDVKIDLINKPERVVVGKSIRRRYALLFHTLLSVLGVAIGLLLNWKIGFINFISGFLLWWYSNFLKRQPFVGNIAVAVLTGFSVYVVAVLFDPFNKLIIGYALFSFFITLLREIIKDMEDLKGDNSFGCKTLPIVLGVRKSKAFMYLLSIINLAFIAWFNHSYVGLAGWMLAVFILTPVVLIMIGLSGADTVKDFYRLSQCCKIVLLLGVLSMIFI